MTEFLPKSLARGTLTTSVSDVYTVGAGKVVIVRNIHITTKVSSEVVINIQAVFGEGAIYFAPKDLIVRPGRFIDFPGNDLILEAGHSLRMWADSNASIDFIVSGVEATL